MESQSLQNNDNMSDKISQVESFFQGYAEDFDSIYQTNSKKNWMRQMVDQRLRSSMSDRFMMSMQCLLENEVTSILDIGCGPGRYAFDLAKEGKHVTALDIAPAMLEIAQNIIKKAGLKKNVDFA